MAVRAPRAASKKIRRVVTEHTPEGKSVFVSDGAPPRIEAITSLKGFSITPVWATDHGMTALPGCDDPTQAMTQFVPGWGGTRFLITVFPPEGQAPARRINRSVVAGEMAAKLPGLGDAMELENPGMHTTETVDYDITISGKLSLELDDGKEVHLKPWLHEVPRQNGISYPGNLPAGPRRPDQF